MELVLHNSDMVREILLWLPAKSLVKFQSVCRDWLFLISSTAFKQKHTLRSPKLQQQSLILQTATLPRRWFYLNPTSRRLTSLSRSRLPSDLIILQSSNGLLLLQPENLGRNQYVYVHNPATRQSRKIIAPPSTSTNLYFVSVVLAFNPSKSPYYELFCLRTSPTDVESCVEVYSSESHSWKELTLGQCKSNYLTYLGIASIYVFRPRVGVYWNNAIYWSSKIKLNRYFCFDIAKLEIKFVDDRPATDHRHEEKNAYWCLQVSNGRLFHVELMESEGGRETMAVWELDGRHWLLRQRCVLTSTAPAPGVGWEVHSTSFVHLVDTCSLLICRDGWMRAYDLNTGSYEDFPDATGHPFCDEGIQFVGTLALV